ncbi:MAG: tetratricopeptide repeat protein [Acidobacteria bacterium]|nr:tetratricopeptide repeat protein [Acidobacteriota bacterium]
MTNLREAARLDQAGKCSESEQIYQRALSQQNAAGPVLWNNVGNHYLICRQPEKARAYFEKVTRAVPLHLNANLQLARMEVAGGAFGSAETRLSKLLPGNGRDFDVLLLLGTAAARAGSVARAKEVLESALALRADDVTAMVEAGLANAATGDYPRAVFLLARAQAREPAQAAIALALARAAEDAGYYGDAAVAYDRYVSLAPGNTEARRDRARVYALSGRAQGIEELRSYVEAHTSDALGHFYLAQVTWKEDSDGALRELAEALRIDPRLAAAHSARGWLLHRLGRSEEALGHLRAAVKLRPDDYRARDQMGVVLLSLDRAREAEPELRRAAALAPRDPAVALHLGRALTELGSEEEGRKWLDAHERLRAGRQRDPRRESGMIDLAVMDPDGRRTRELERFRTMAASRPDDPLLHLHLAGLLLEDGQTDAALRAYKTLEGMNAEASIWVQAASRLLEAGWKDAAGSFYERAGLPADPLQSALQLAVAARYDESLALLRKGRIEGAEGRLLEAIVASLRGEAQSALERLTAIEAQWPDWGRARLVHGLLLREQKRGREAAAQLRQAAALGAGEDVTRCATLREWVSASCGR